MLSLSTRPAATRVAGSRRCIASPAPVIASSSRRRSVLRPKSLDRHRLAAVPDEQNTGRRTGGPQDVSVGSDVPSSDNNPDMDPAEKYSDREGAEGVAHFAEPGSGGSGTQTKSDNRQQEGGRDVSDMITDLSGGAKAAANRVKDAAGDAKPSSDNEQMTGTRSGGPQDVSVGSDVPSSDTHPDMDPAESDAYTKRESKSDAPNSKSSGSSSSSSSSSGGSSGSRGTEMSADEGRGVADTGRDLSDMINKNPGASSSSSRGDATRHQDSESSHGRDEDSDESAPRVHPVARTAGTAAASAAGTIIGAAAGPVGAAAGAAIGAAIGRKAADMMGGNEEQAEIYNKGEEPDQVAGELKSAGSEIREAAHTAQAKAGDLVDRATEKTSRDSGGSSDHQSGSKSGQGSSNESRGSPYESRSAQTPGSGTGLSSNVSDQSRSASDQARSTSSKVSDATRSGADRVAGAAESLKETAVDAAHGAADRIGDAADRVGGDRLEGDQTVQGTKKPVSGAAESAKDKLGSAAEEAKDRTQSAAGAVKERLGGAGDRAADAADNTARTAADYGSKASEKAQEISNKGQGSTESSKADWGSGSSAREWGSGSADSAGKSNVKAPMDNDLAHNLGAAAAAGGYGDAAADLEVDAVRSKSGGVESKNTEVFATRGLGEPEAGYRKGGGEDLSTPEGRLAAGGADSQAAVGAAPEILSKVGTSDSTAERIAEVYGVGPEASSGAKEAETYRAESGPDRKKDTA